MFDIFPRPDRPFNAQEQTIVDLVKGVTSVEEAITELIYRRYRLTFGSFLPEASEMLCMVVTQHGVAGLGKPQHEVLTVVPHAKVKSPHPWAPISEALPMMSDSRALVLDEEWIQKRDDRLRVTHDSWEGAIVAPANALVPLIMSYATIPFGMVHVSRETVELKSPYVADVASLQLQYAPPTSKQLLQEKIGVRLQLLERKIARQQKRAPLAERIHGM